jgi:starch-binding outer membrane protein, SusD/RagB family
LSFQPVEWQITPLGVFVGTPTDATFGSNIFKKYKKKAPPTPKRQIMKKNVFSCFAIAILFLTACHKNDSNPSTPPVSLSTAINNQLAKTDSLSDFTTFLKAAPLTQNELSAGVTIFAPSNNAFGTTSVSAASMLPDSSVARDYMVKGLVKASDLTNGKTFTTLSGKSLTVTVVGDPVYYLGGMIFNINPVSLADSFIVYSVGQLLNALPPLSFTVWDATKWSAANPKGLPATAVVQLYHSQQDWVNSVNPAYEANTDKDGVAFINGVRPGNYYVFAFTAGPVSNILGPYYEVGNDGLGYGYVADTVLDSKGNFIYKDVNGDGVVNSQDEVPEPSLMVTATKNKTSNTTLLVGNFYKLLQSVTDGQNMLDSAYAGFQTAYANLVAIDGVLSDDAGCGSQISYCPFDNYTEPASSPLLAPIWDQAYTNIGRVNHILRDAPFMTGAASDISNLVAQARALRAATYFSLVSYFGDVPYDIDLPGTLFPGVDRNASASILDSVVSDLTAAIPNLPATQSVEHTLAIDRYTAQFLLAKTDLYLQQYSNAAYYAGAILNGGPYQLTSTPYGWLTGLSSTETIWAPNYSNIGLYLSWYYNGKLPVSVAAVPVATYTEALLIDAEARINTGSPSDMQKAQDDLNLLQQRSGQSSVSFTTAAAAYPILQSIWRREMLYQGDRFYNMVRWGLTSNPAYQSTGFHIGISELLPIPLSYLINYIGIRQNPGY